MVASMQFRMTDVVQSLDKRWWRRVRWFCCSVKLKPLCKTQRSGGGGRFLSPGPACNRG